MQPVKICTCGDYLTIHHNKRRNCERPLCECKEYVPVAKNWKISNGHNTRMKGKIYPYEQGVKKKYPETIGVKEK